MDILSNLAGGFAAVLTWENLFYCFAGVTMGTFIGVLPGLGAMLGIALLLPVTFYLPPEAAIIMLAGIYYGGEYGGSIAAILINVPGTPSSAVACLDGYPMTKQGRAAVALFSSAMASFVAGTIGIALMAAFSPLIAQFALTFGSVEYFAVMLLGLIGAVSVARGSRLKALVAVVFGILFGTVGTDVSTGVQRFTLGYPELITGLSLVALAMGIFGMAEIIATTGRSISGGPKPRIRMRDMLPTRDEWRRSFGPVGRGTAVGAVLGALPGTGPTIASFMAYAFEKRVSRRGKDFGKGMIEGLVAPESANNAAAQTAFIPTLTLGIPGTATMALLLGALMIQGIPPGPRLMTDNAELFWALVAPGETPRYYRVVGVVGDLPASSLEGAPATAVYYPIMPVPGEGFPVSPSLHLNLLVKTSGHDASGLASSIRNLVGEQDPTVAMDSMGPMSEFIARSTSHTGFSMRLFAVAAVVVLLLAAAGLYGVISYLVARRTHEIGIRLALGAARERVQWLVMAGSLKMVGAGLAIGAMAALALARVIEGMFYGVHSADPLIYLGAAAILMSVAVLASFIPARQAAGIEPIEALRHE